MIVAYASALIEVLLRTSGAALVEARIFATGETLHAPYLIDVEIAQVIRRYAAGGEIDGARGRAALDDLPDFPVRRYAHDFLLPRVWDLRYNPTAYDAVYVALAEALDATLVTRDRRLASASGHRARIELVRGSWPRDGVFAEADCRSGPRQQLREHRLVDKRKAFCVTGGHRSSHTIYETQYRR